MNNYEVKENDFANFELTNNGNIIAISTHRKPLENRKKELEQEGWDG